MERHWSLFSRTDQMTQDPLPHITQIDSTFSEDRVVEFLHLAHAFVDEVLPRPGSAVSLIDERNGLHHERGIVEKFGMHTENSGLPRAEARFDFLMQLVKLILCGSEGLLQLVPFGDGIAGMVCDDDGLLRVLANRTDGQPTGSSNAGNGRGCILGNPALNAAARSRGSCSSGSSPSPTAMAACRASRAPVASGP